MKKILLFSAMAFFVLLAGAQSKLTPFTQLFLQHHADNAAAQVHSPAGLTAKSTRCFVKTVKIGGVESIGTFITVNDDSDIDAIKSLGAVINARVGDIVMAQVPIDKLADVAQLASVTSVDVAKPLSLNNDSVRNVTNVNLVQTLTAGTGLTKAYKGAGVVVGVVDDGIDYNHPAFKDANGVSRVKRVYQPDDTTGSSPVIEGVTLHGSEYTTPQQISALTTDNTQQAHGTHTTGTAVGSYMGNAFYGMAPEADIVLCGCGDDLSDYNIAMSIKYIFNYAESVGKPAVVNLSLGNHNGAHDGTAVFTKVMNELTGKGKIISISAGNEGSAKLHIYKKFTASDSILQSAIIYGNNFGGIYIEDNQDFWTRNTDYKTPPALQFLVVDMKKDSILYTSKKFTASGSLDPATDSEFSNFYNDKIDFSMGKIANGKFEIITQFNDLYANDINYCIIMRYFCDSLTSADVWDMGQKFSFTDLGFHEYTDGNSDISINNLATGNNTISVGAFNSKLKYHSLDGMIYSINATLGDIADFSSYGPDINGIARPEVLAPGQTLISSLNSYDSDISIASCSDSLSYGSRTYCWGQMSGTSMAAPVVSGIIALWLQANPNLTPDDIKDVLKNSCKSDAFVTGNPKKSGYGKIDALAGLKYILSTTGIKGVRNDNAKPVLLYPNPSDGNFTVCTPSESGNVNMSIYNVAGALVYSRTFDGSNGAVDVNLNGAVAPGIYVLHLNGAITNYSSRFILK
ncbi:MAG: S8 family peptidase [Muribaculaceae bacterium]|jgi:minor extracellular serine protease Vpr|nr:S8 family peptidase [Muribaculaceae bacterium]